MLKGAFGILLFVEVFSNSQFVLRIICLAVQLTGQLQKEPSAGRQDARRHKPLLNLAISFTTSHNPTLNQLRW